MQAKLTRAARNAQARRQYELASVLLDTAELSGGGRRVLVTKGYLELTADISTLQAAHRKLSSAAAKRNVRAVITKLQNALAQKSAQITAKAAKIMKRMLTMVADVVVNGKIVDDVSNHVPPLVKNALGNREDLTFLIHAVYERFVDERDWKKQRHLKAWLQHMLRLLHKDFGQRLSLDLSPTLRTPYRG